MKKLIFRLFVLCLVLAGCTQEGVYNGSIEQKMKSVSISAEMDGIDARASIDSETGAFAWQSGDVISVLATDGKFYDFVLEGESGTKTAEFVGQIPETAEITTVATYPRIVANGTVNTVYSDGTLNYVLPAEWTYAKDVSNVPMVASFEEGAEHISFKQVGGVMRFPVKNLPMEATFVVTVKGKSITGEFPVDIAKLGTSAMSAADTDSELSISYSSEVDGASAEFNVPVPVGTYNEFIVTVKDAEGNAIFTKEYKKEGNAVDNQVNRAVLMVMKEITLPEHLMVPQFTSFQVNESFATGLEKEFVNVRLPYGTDVSALPVNYTVSEGTVSVNGTEIKPFTKLDFSSPVKFVITGKDGTQYTYIVSVSYSHLPVVYIKTKDGAPIVSKEKWLKNSEIYVTNAGEYDKVYEESQIRGRGNTTWGYPKKPYAIKLDKKDEVLGMPKHKRWVLLANYVDKTCIRNSVAFELARRMEGLDWTPRGQHVDVVVNGVFNGTYFLCEQIKVDENRVNITEMEATDTDPEAITGGYLLEVDKNYDEVNKFESYCLKEVGGTYWTRLPFMVKEPDEDVLCTAQFEYIKNHIEEIRKALYEVGSTTEGYLQYVDLDSFIDYWIVYEMTGTGEPTHPKSVYMYKDRGGKMHAGPVWDFDYFTFQPYYSDDLINVRAVWNSRIIRDPANLSYIKQRWNTHRESIRSIIDEIDRQYSQIKESAEYNSTIWPILPGEKEDPNRDKSLSLDAAVARIKTYYLDKFNWMDKYINNCSTNIENTME